MFTIKEVLGLAIAIIILSFSNSFANMSNFLISAAFFLVIVLVYTLSKKVMAYYLDAEEETKIWSMQRYGISEESHFKNPIPVGIIIPFILAIISLGRVPWFAVTESEVKPLETRAVRRHDFYSFAEMTEYHIGLISVAGIVSMFFLSILAYLVNLPELSRLSIYYAFFNLLPIGKLDGTRIFFGTRRAALWITLEIITIIGLLYSLMI